MLQKYGFRACMQSGKGRYTFEIRYMGVNKPFVITIVGAESSGKTTLAMQLADYFNCAWVPEYAREYLKKINRPYELVDLEEIARGQLRMIKEGMAKSSELSVVNGETSDVSGESLVNHDVIKMIISRLADPRQPILIVDGGMLNIHLWSKIKFNETIPLVQEALNNDATDLYLLCRPVVEWTPDPFREAPTILDRAWIYNVYLRELSQHHTQFEIIDNQSISSV